MTTKQQALHAIEDLPENATWEDVEERIQFMRGVLKGLSELDRGEGIPHDQIMKEIDAWIAN